MKLIVEKIIAQQSLATQECESIIHAIAKNSISTEYVVSILTGIQMRGIQLEELEGFRTALLSVALPIDLDKNAIDLCGTGGDGKNTFNISTTTSLVLAAMNYKVIKHGNYGISSICGSSNVLEALGFSFSTDQKYLEKSLNQSNICFLHAPLFHPTLKKVAEIRKNLGIRTLFNSLGPLVNPCQPNFQITGTYSLELAKIYHHILHEKRINYKVMFGLDGYDELTFTNDTRIFGTHEDTLRTSKDFAIPSAIHPNAISGGTTLKESAEIVKAITNGIAPTEHIAVIAANVAEAMHCVEPTLNLIEAYQAAKSFILSGQTAKHFKLN